MADLTERRDRDDGAGAAGVERPFLSFLTPTYRRPQLLAACMESVRQQTVPCEQVIVHDTVGRGIAGMFAMLPAYASALHGEYVHILADDDVLCSDLVVEAVAAFCRAQPAAPDVIVVRAQKNGLLLPLAMSGPPALGAIDLGCLITRRDVWQGHVGDYGRRYEGDYDFARALWEARRSFAYCDVLFERGPALRGAPCDMGWRDGTWGR